ncbi:protein Skeletor, isoforms B/C-like [Lytechinus pictus]|uniref:protein Skeletor, isoforms B/C-like n=1 Tax=Lytechinus pictus TaxID=7653 RepID=UPI0030B9CE04
MVAIITSRRFFVILSLFYKVVSLCQAQYHGKLIGSLSDLSSHRIAGTVYAETSTQIRIIGFNYDGTAPDAFLWAGVSGTPSSDGFIIPDETGSLLKLEQYDNVDISVSLPAGRTVSSLAWISVWCRSFTANFGQVIIPGNFVAPSPLSLGPLGFSPLVHKTEASDVTILNSKQIRVTNLFYDGLGPRAYFWVGPGGTPSNGANDRSIPDENGGTGVIRRYSGETIVLTLPDELTVSDIGHFGLWCIAFSQDFGHVDISIPNNHDLPPLPFHSGTSGPRRLTFPNCETLVDEKFQVSWKIDGSDIIIRLSSLNGTDYAAFGLSGSTTGTQMIGGDVVVTFMDNQTPRAVDYYLKSQAQCTPQNGDGACPDTISSEQGSNDSVVVESYVENGVTHITYRRPLAATDATYDQAYTTNGPVYVIWARGPINADGRVAFHNIGWSKSNSNLQIDFGRNSSACSPLGQGGIAPPVADGWEIPGITRLEEATFTVEMGLSGGRKGYQAITGRVGWGIAWFINGILIPELTLKRNVTYTFRVFGGDNANFSGNYHPFYITDDINGGYGQLSEADREGIKIYAGPVEGPLCQYMSDTNPDSYNTFDEFKATLEKNCLSGDPGVLEWTVPIDAPDLLYYHCYTHRFLGWKIHITDSATTVSLSLFNIAVLFLLYLIL